MIDFHNHIGRSIDGTESIFEDLMAILDEAGVKQSVVFAIDTGGAQTNYAEENDRILSYAAAAPGRLIPFCRVSPKRAGLGVEEMRRCEGRGFAGLKLHPHCDAFTAADCGPVLEEAERLHWPVVLHCEHRSPCRPAEWEAVFRKHTGTAFVLVHSGKDDWQEAGKLAAALSHVYLDTTTLSYNRTKVLLSRVGPDKLIFGSDYPYSHLRIEKTKYDLLLSTDEARAKVFWENAEKLLAHNN